MGECVLASTFLVGRAGVATSCTMPETTACRTQAGAVMTKALSKELAVVLFQTRVGGTAMPMPFIHSFIR